MAATVTPFRNRDNYAKYQLFYYETGTNVIIQVLQWMYKGQRPIEENLVDLAKTNAIMKQNTITAPEKSVFEELKNGNVRLTELDLTLLYKIIQIVCGLSPRNDPVWNRHCPPNRQDELEHLLYKLKDGRNNLAHPSSKVKDITDSNVEDKCEELKLLYTSILQQAGLKANADPHFVKDVINLVKNDIERICKDDKIDQSMKAHLKNLLMNDLKSVYEDDLNSFFENELKGYSAPFLKRKGNHKATIHLQDLLTFDDSEVVIVVGEAGEGKTAMTRFLFHSWLFGIRSSVSGLSSFDIALRVDCRHIDSRDVSQFIEDRFPIAYYSFSNTSSLKKHIDEFKVLWIMDGFDESTAEFKTFLKAITKRFPRNHKLIVTTRPSTYEELARSLSKLAVVPLSLELLRDSNIEEIMINLIGAEDKLKAFRAEFISLDESALILLRTPLNMTLYIKLWLEDASQARGSYTSKILFLKTTMLHLKELKKRLEERTSLTEDDLTRKVDLWFYGSLCKQSFLITIKWCYNISNSIVEILKEDANVSLIPSYCLSSFLLEAKGRDGRIRYDFKHEVQQNVLASLFVKNLSKYSNSPLKEDMNNVKTFPVIKLLTFYMKMVNEDDSINSETQRIFNPVKEIVSVFKAREQCMFWCVLSIMSSFHKKFMKNVSHTLKGVPFVDTAVFSSYLDIAKFVTCVRPKMIRFTVKNYMELQRREELMELLRVLEINKTEIYLHTVFDELDGVIGTSGIDKINEASLKITSLSGTMPIIPLLSNHHRSLETVELVIYSESAFIKLLEFLQEHKTLTEVKIYIIFDNFRFSLIQFPKELIQNTTLTFRLVTEDNLDNFILFVHTLKGDHSSKFKAIFYGVEQIAFGHKERLDEVASVVVVEKNRYFRRLPIRPEFLMYTTTMEADEVENWSYYKLSS